MTPIQETTVNGIPGIGFYADVTASTYRSQSILLDVARMLRRARVMARSGDIGEAIRSLSHANFCRGVVAVDGRGRPSTERVNRAALAVEGEIMATLTLERMDLRLLRAEAQDR